MGCPSRNATSVTFTPCCLSGADEAKILTRNNDGIHLKGEIRHPLSSQIYADVFIFCILTSLDAFKVLAWGFMGLELRRSLEPVLRCQSQTRSRGQFSLTAKARAADAHLSTSSCTSKFLSCDKATGHAANRRAAISRKQLPPLTFCTCDRRLAVTAALKR